MGTRTTLVVAVLSAAIVSAVAAVTARAVQSVPPLAGSWTLTSDSNEVGPLGRQITVTLDAESITFVGGDRVTTHRLDGGRSTYTSQNSRGRAYEHESQTRWVGSALLGPSLATTRPPRWNTALEGQP